MNNIEELLNNWSETRTFEEKPYRHLMSECTVTMDDRVPEKGRGLDGLINEARRKVKSMTDKIRKSIEIER